MAVVVPTITSEGQALDPTVQLLSLEIRKELDRIPEARLVILDGSVAAREFAVSNTAFFAPGKAITIALRVGDDPDAQVFAGLVVRHAVEARDDGLALRVELRDAAIALTRRRRSAVYRDQRDDAVLRKLIGDAGLEVGAIDDTRAEHKELVQFYATDWDFLLARADVSGLVVVVDDGAVSARSMTAAARPKVTIEFGLDDVREFELEQDAAGQWSGVTGLAWDLAQQAPTQPVEAADTKTLGGAFDPAAVAGKLGGDAYTLHAPVPLAAAELQPWADARLARSRLSLLRGRIVVAGRADLRPFDRVELRGVGDRFDGPLLVSGVVHRVDLDGWRTELQIGLSPEWFARTPDIADPPAAGLLPPVGGLQVGLVGGFEADPDGEHRIKVRLAGLDSDDNAVWARVARPDAGKDRGFGFWPEPGDEVVVGFLAGDPRQAIVLGSLFGAVNAPPKAAGGPTEKNELRALVSRSGTEISFDDKKNALTLKTPKASTIVVDDDAEAITIKDLHGNTITMDKDGIKLESAGDFAVDAKGKVTIKGSAVDLQ